MPTPLRYLLLFLALAGMQILVLTELELGGFAIPKIFPLFVLLLAPNLPLPLYYTLAFLTGLIVDLFTHTVGAGAFTCTLIAFIRNAWLTILNPTTTLENVGEIRIESLSLTEKLRYIVPLHVFFELVYTGLVHLEVNFYIIGSALASAVYSLLFIVTFLVLTANNRAR
jgi:hypothetical protein